MLQPRLCHRVCLGRPGGPAWPQAEMAFPEGQGRSLMGGSGLPWSTLAAAALSSPPALESTVGWKSCSSGVSFSFPWLWQQEHL